MNSWLNPDTFEIDPWKMPAKPSMPSPRPDFADDENLKQAFGIALGRGLAAFDAGMELFEQVLPKALWASMNWINDPIVQASKDAYVKSLKKAEKPLDKEELLSKILSFADEKVMTKEGIAVPLVEAKVRLDALKLYSEISGFTGRVNIDASTNINNIKNETNNTMKIVLVRGAEAAPTKTIEASNIQSRIENNAAPPIALKLVGGTPR